MKSALISFAFPLASTFGRLVVGIVVCLETSNTSHCAHYMAPDDITPVNDFLQECVKRFVTSESHLRIWLYGDMEEVTTSKPVTIVTTASGMGTTAADGNAKERDQGNPYTCTILLTLSNLFKYSGTPLFWSPYPRVRLSSLGQSLTQLALGGRANLYTHNIRNPYGFLIICNKRADFSTLSDRPP